MIYYRNCPICGIQLTTENKYWFRKPDFYDELNNIVVEYDESTHYDRNWKLLQKDVERMNLIKEHMKCKFYRYNEVLDELKEY